ncbi:MAG: preprotein translocase subunit YajC [Burkholderiales bacterium]|nr:preprotein translocase subunit YajC [Burkholderiales bacterium]
MIANAYAQAGAPGADAGMLNIGMLVLMLVVFYFILIRPQMKRAKEHKAMIDALEKGAEVVTAGGIVGRITKIADAYITLEVAPNTEITVQKQAVQTLLPKGSIKAL